MEGWLKMKVKNRSYLIKLAKKILKANKSRRNLLLIAIILTSILFTSLFSVVLGIAKSMEAQTMKTVGTVSHGSFKELSDEDIRLLSKDKAIKEYSVSKKVGILDDEKIMAELSYMDENGFNWAMLENIKGGLPRKEEDIFIDLNLAKKLGYKGEIGEKISIPFIIEIPYTGEILEKKVDNFVIAGTFTGPIDSNVGVGLVYLSKPYVDKLCLSEKANDMQVKLNNSFMIKDKLLKIAGRNGYTIADSPGNLSEKEIRIGVNFAYILSGGEGIDYLVFLPVLLFLFLISLAGFLIINNIFKISVNEDIKLFGGLKTIGMTKVQVKKLVHLESLIISLPSIIIGNILGLIIGRFILKKILENNFMLAHVKISWLMMVLIIVFSSVFALITIYFSVMSPASYASKISPIEAYRYNENEVTKKYKSDSISLSKLGRRQVFSNKFRFVSIVLSISLSAVILNSALTYTGNIDIKKGLSDIIVTDYNIASPKYFRYSFLGSDDGVNKEFIDSIENTKGFKGGGALYHYGLKYDYPDVKIEDTKIVPVILAMDDYILNNQRFIEGEFDKEKWKAGDYIIVGEDSQNISNLSVGDVIKIKVNKKIKEVKIMAKIDYNFSNGLRYYKLVHEDPNDEASQVLPLEYIYLNPSLYEVLTEDKTIMSYGFDVEDRYKEKFDELLETLEANSDFSYDSRDIQIQSFKDFKNLIEFVGYSLSFILFLISVLNFINIIATEILRNMVNLSILEAIGMTKKSIKKYLIKKNLIYSISGFVFSFIIMLVVDELILKQIMAHTRWASFSFVIFPLILVNLVNMVIGIVFTSKFYQRHSQNSLVDRIRNLK